MPKSMNKTDHGGLLSGSTLKWLAILLMLIDHVGASLLEVFVLNGYSNSPLAGLTGNVEMCIRDRYRGGAEIYLWYPGRRNDAAAGYFGSGCGGGALA